MRVAVEVFPVVPVATATAPTVTRAGRVKRCIAAARTWYADWHEQPRGRFTHHAQDIFGPLGSPVLAPNAGVIVASSATSGPSGKGGHYVKLAVVDTRGRTHRTYYLAHLRTTPLVAEGDQVEAGDQVGELGRSGNATRTCPHLHIGARRYIRGRAINIYEELRAAQRAGPPTAGPKPTEPAEPTTACEADS